MGPVRRGHPRRGVRAIRTARQGLTFGVYYSVKDWHFRDYPTRYTYRTKNHPDGFHGLPDADADFMKYLDYMEGQLRELMTGYGRIGALWFDWYGDAFEREDECRRAQQIIDMVHELQPDCVVNDRLGGVGADFATAEQTIPGSGGARPFEVCMTVADGWGYNPDDSAKDGSVLIRHGEAVYDTTGGPSMRWEADLAAVTRRPGKEYLHLDSWPEDGRIFYNDFPHRLTRAYLLADPERTPLPVDVHHRSLMIHLPTEAPGPIGSVIVLAYEEH